MTSADDSRRLRVQKPPDIELPPAAALTSAQYSIDEGYYDSIVSPTYLVMTRPTASARRTSQPSAADSIAGAHSLVARCCSWNVNGWICDLLM